MLHRRLLLMFLRWVIPINCLDFQTLLEPYLLYKIMLKGYGTLGAHLDSRMPITLPILTKILKASSRFSCSKYQICQFQAMCSLAFYAFLRVGEMTSTTGHGPQPLQLHQVVRLVNDSNSIVALRVTFQDF